MIVQILRDALSFRKRPDSVDELRHHIALAMVLISVCLVVLVVSLTWAIFG